MAVDKERKENNPIDQAFWCRITWRRSYVWCAFVALMEDSGEEVVRSPLFRWRDGGSGPAEAPDAVSCLAVLETTLVGEGWEPVDESPGPWHARRFRLPLSDPIAPDRARSAPIAFVDPASTDGLHAVESERLKAEPFEDERVETGRSDAEPFEADRVEVAPKAERLEAERLEAARLEFEQLVAARLELERREAERLELARVESERMEAERLEAERLERERRLAEQESRLRDLIASYSADFDRALDVRRFYGDPSPQLDPDRFSRRIRRRRRR